MSKSMYKCNESPLPATVNNYFKLNTDVHSYNTKLTNGNLLYQKQVQPHVRKSWSV